MRQHTSPPVWMIIITIFIALTASAVSAQGIPDGAEGKSYYVAFPVTIALDGNLTDWNGLPRQTVTTGPVMPADANNGGALRFAAASDYNNLYFMFEVNDSRIVSNLHGAQYWFEDSVELYLNGTGKPSINVYEPGVAQITIPALNMGRSINDTIIAGRRSETVGARAIVVKTSYGYAVEVAVPLRTSVWSIQPTQDGRVGFQVQLNSASLFDRDMKLSWSLADRVDDQSYVNPSVFGELIFWKINNDPAPIIIPTKPVIVLPTKPVIVIPKVTSTPTNSVIVIPTATGTEDVGAETETVEPPTETPVPPTATVTATPVPPTATLTATPVPPTATSAPVTPDGPTTGGFTVQGATIYDPDGNVFVPKGINVSGYNWVWPRKTIKDIDLIDNCWNFNLVRVNSFLFWGRVQWQQYEMNNDLDQIVKGFTSRGIVVVFEGHDHIGSYYQGSDLETLIEWYVDLATRYRNNPYVWFDVMNEPGDRTAIDHDQWVNMHGRVIEAIRNTAGANNVIIVEGAFGGQDSLNDTADPVTESAILLYSQDVLNYNGNSFENIVFSIHTYDLWNHGDAKLADFLDRAKEQGLAMVVGEYGVFTDRDTKAAAETTFNVLPSRGVGRIAWHWDGSDFNDLTVTGGGWMINDCQTPTNLSWFGQKIWDDNHSEP